MGMETPAIRKLKKKAGGGGEGDVVFLELFSPSGFLIWLEKKTNHNKINYYRNAKQHNIL